MTSFVSENVTQSNNTNNNARENNSVTLNHNLNK